MLERPLDLPADGNGWPAFPFEQSQSVPQSDDFPLFDGVHAFHSGESAT
jgi:hypothetical protein